MLYQSSADSRCKSDHLVLFFLFFLKFALRNRNKSLQTKSRSNSISSANSSTRQPSKYTRVNKATKESFKVKKEATKSLQPWMVYNDAFAEKQCEAYTVWLNYILKSQEEIVSGSSSRNDSQMQQPQMDDNGEKDETDDNPTLRSLFIERRRMQATQRAIQFFNGHEMKSIRKVLKMEVISKRLSMRSDHDVLANVNLRSQMISLLLSYSTPWLKLGLETLFDEKITLTMATKSIEKTLKIRKSLGISSSKSKMVSF